MINRVHRDLRRFLFFIFEVNFLQCPDNKQDNLELKQENYLNRVGTAHPRDYRTTYLNRIWKLLLILARRRCKKMEVSKHHLLGTRKEILKQIGQIESIIEVDPVRVNVGQPEKIGFTGLTAGIPLRR